MDGSCRERPVPGVVIISVGYRVKSRQGTQFRLWATQRLRDDIIKGFALDDRRLKQAGSPLSQSRATMARALRSPGTLST